MNTFLQDLRYAVRTLGKNPGFTIVAVLAVALGIATATTMFTFFNAILLKPIPGLEDEGRLVSLKVFIEKKFEQGGGFSQPNFLDLREATKTLEGAFMLEQRTFIFAGGEKPERYLGAWISANGFATLGVKPAVGRLFRADEENDGAAPVALLAYDVWQRRFGGRESVVGQSVVLNGAPVTVVGVMPKGFRFPQRADVWMPFRYERDEVKRSDFSFPVWARLRPGVTHEQAQVEMSLLAARLAERFPAINSGMGIRVLPMREEMTADIGQLLQLMLGAVIFVLLIACANVANLLLAKAASRSRETAIRAALGATRRRIISAVLAESALLGLGGGALGVLFSLWGVDLILAGIPVELPFWLKFELDWRVLLFAFGAACVSSLIFGLFPAWQVSRPDLNRALKEGGRAGGSNAPAANRTRNALVVAQLALALVLLVGAGLMTRSFLNLQHSYAGVDANNVLTFRVGLPPTQFKKDEQARFFHDLLPHLRAIPGVESAGLISALPSTGDYSYSAFQVEGRPLPKNLADAPGGMRFSASPGTFQALKIPLLRGRLFDDTDTRETPRVVLIDQRFAEQIFPGEDPLGKRVLLNLHELPGKEEQYGTIVGVVGNVRQQIQVKLPERSIWVSQTQEDENFLWGVLRVKGDPLGYLKAVQAAVLATKADIPIYYGKTLIKVMSDEAFTQRFFGYLFAAFAGVALLLAAVGIYGVMAYSVNQRTQEIGVRMALGALRSDVTRLVLARGAKLAAVGLALGLLASGGLAPLLAGSLYGISPGDPPVFLTVPVLLALVALAACWVPARRAARVDPMVALRQE